MFKKTPLTAVLLRRTSLALALGICLSLLQVFHFGLKSPQLNTVEAATSSTLNFQARLLSATGALVPDGYYNIEFKLYSASSGGSALWTDTRYDQNGVTAGQDYRLRVANGYFSVYLADTTVGGTAFPSTIDWDQELWLTMNVGGSNQTATPTWDGEMNPRLKLTAVPYAFKAGTALSVATNNTNAASTNSVNVSIQSGNAAGATSNSGNINIDAGTATGTAGTINLGASNASAIVLGRSGITTTNAGALTVSQLLTANLGATIQGATTSINASSNFATNINTGTSTGAVSIGNSAAGAIALQSASTIGLTATTTVTGLSAGSATSLTVNNSTSTGSIFVAQDNGTPVFTIADGGAITATNTLSLAGSAAFLKGTDFSTTGTSNNVDFGAVSLTRLTGASAQTITGIANGTDGEILTIVNAGANTATISNLSGSSSAANQITTGTGSDVALLPGASIKLVYDSADSLWRVVGGTATSGTGVTTVGAIDTTPTAANGARISGTSIFMQYGDASFPGLISTTTQSIAGAKTFSSVLGATAGATISGATSSINASSNFATNINTGTSTGAVSIGNSLAGTIALQSASTIGLTGTTTVTGLGSGSATALTVNNSTSTGSIFVAQDNGTPVFTIADGGAVTATQLVTLNGGLTVETGDIFTFNGDAFDDLTGTGLTIASGDLTVDTTYFNNNYIQKVPASTAANTITPTANSTVALTINGTSGTAATALDIIQAGAATAVSIAQSAAANGLNITSSNASQTTSTALNVVQSGTTTGFTGNFVNFTGSSTTGSGNLLNLTSVNTSAGNALNVTANGLTSGDAVDINHTTSVITTGALLRVRSTAADAFTTGALAHISSSGNFTTTANTAGLLNVSADATAAGTLANIANSFGSQTTSTLLNVIQSGTTTGYTGNVVNFTGSSTTGAANLLNLSSANTTAGNALNVTANALTTGDAVNINSTSTGLTTGSLLRVLSATTAAVATDGIVSFQASGNYTSTSNAGLVNALANSTTAGTIVNIQGTSLTTGTALNINAGVGVSINSVGTNLLTGPASGTGVALTVSNSTSTGNILVLNDNATAVVTVVDGGAATFRNQTNSTSAFSIQNVAGTSLFNVDTTNQRITVAAHTDFDYGLSSPFGGFGIISNLMDDSEDFTSSAFGWTRTNITDTADTTLAPNGETTADTLTSTAAGGFLYNETGYNTANTMTFSVWIRSSSGSQPFDLRIDAPSGTPATGTAASYTATTTWKRYHVTQTVTGTPSSYRPRIIITNNASTIIAWGAQFIPGTVPGAYFRGTGESFFNPSDQGLSVSGRLNLRDCLHFGNGDVNSATSLCEGTLHAPDNSFEIQTNALTLSDTGGTDGLLFSPNSGTDITTFSNQALNISAAGTGDIVFGTDADTNFQLTPSAASGVDLFSIVATAGSGITTNNVDGIFLQIEGGNGSANSVSGLHVDFDPIAASGDETFTGLLIDGITSTSATENAITIGNGWDSDILFLTDAAHVIRVQAQDTAATAGSALSIVAGTGNTSGVGGTLTLTGGIGGNAATGGNLILQGGAAGGGNTNGANVVLSGGAGTGSGVKGLVVIDTPTITTATTQNCSSTCNITQANIDANGVVVLNATNPALDITLTDPTITTAGRIVYVTAALGSNDFTLLVNGGGTGNEIAMRANTTATMIWNGTDWTAAGASSSTTLQAAYDNTLTSAGGAEIVLAASGGSVDGFTIRNNPTAPISGGIFEVQSSIGTNLFSVNSLATDLAANGGAEDSTNFSTNWTALGGSTITRNTTAGQYATGIASVNVAASTTAGNGVRQNLASNPAVSTVYMISFTARLASGSPAFTDLRVDYTPTGAATGTQCIASQTILTTGWTRITCEVTTPGTAVTNPDILIYQVAAAGSARTFYIDNVSMTLADDAGVIPNNVQIGGGIYGGAPTLFTLDRSSAPPVANGNETYLGSMYYDTTTGRIQCYESDGWGACGSAPNNYVNLTPEYPGSVLNGTGIGTMTADFCANQTSVLQVNTSFCSSGEALNYYAWTSPQATQQTYSIYISYQLPAAFKSFADDNTVTLTARTDNTTNGVVTYEMFRREGGTIAACGTETTVTTSVNTWQTVPINGNEATGCGFTSTSADDFVIFKINMKANSNASVYASTLSFTSVGQ